MRSLVRAWNEFFFTPQPPTPVALFRILYGLLVIADLVLLFPDWLTWYGPHAMMSLETMRKMAPGARIDLYTVLPQTDAWVWAYFWVFLLFAVFLTFGFLTRISSITVFLLLTSMHQRNFFILHSGDTLLRVCGFFLMFAPAGAALSVDRLLRIWKGKEGAEVRPRRPWAQRMIQIQAAFAYFGTFYWKTLGEKWLDGTALYYTTHLEEFRRFPVLEITSPILLKLASWMTLLIEFAAGVLVWIRELRYPVLLAGLALHLSIEYSMNVPLFQWVIMSTYVTFIYPEDLTRAWAWIRRRATAGAGAPVSVIYDGSSARTVRAANLLRALDGFARLRFLDLRSAEARVECPAVTAKEGRNRLVLVRPSGRCENVEGLGGVVRLLPQLWPFTRAASEPGQRRERFSAASAPK